MGGLGVHQEPTGARVKARSQEGRLEVPNVLRHGERGGLGVEVKEEGGVVLQKEL
jgi:hypothetical protein